MHLTSNKILSSTEAQLCPQPHLASERPSVTVYTLNVGLILQKGFEGTSADALKALTPVTSTAHQLFFAAVFILSTISVNPKSFFMLVSKCTYCISLSSVYRGPLYDIYHTVLYYAILREGIY